MLLPILYLLEDVESSGADQAVIDAMKVSVVSKGMDIAAVSVIMGCLVAITFIAAAALLIWARGKRRERLALAAIQSNQPAVAQEIAHTRPSIVPWIIGGIVAIVAIQNLPWGVTVFLILFAAISFIVYSHYKARNAVKSDWQAAPPTWPATSPKQDAAPSQGQDTANRTGGTNAAV